jgi:formate-dependent nitrite reductase cytochrome c552 subunit
MRRLGLSLLVAVLTLVSRPVLAQGPDYADPAACANCHQKQIATFSATKMGGLFQAHPRDSIGRLGCQGCHGPAKAHAESGGDERGGARRI